MVAVTFSANAVARIRFAISPLWEVVTGARLLRGDGASAMHSEWVARARQRVTACGLDRGLLWHLIGTEPGHFPDFLTPSPVAFRADLNSELNLLESTPNEVVRDQLDECGLDAAVLRVLYAEPEAGLRRLCAEIRQFWQETLADDWPSIVALLEAEVFRRMRTLVEHGAGELLNDLHETVRWDGVTLSIVKPHCCAADLRVDAGLVVIPSVFVWPSVLSVPGPEVVQVAYPARGVATLWDERPVRTVCSLGQVLGAGRATLLDALDAPRSTTELAKRTGLTIGGVSQQLRALRGAGLVASQRNGRAVLSARTPLGDALLEGAHPSSATG
jgi:DNA-binding transcriptional ArsR family regulator